MTADSHLLLDTKWFRVVARPQQGGEPYYVLELEDYVSVVALTEARQLLFVRQFRPVVQRRGTSPGTARYACARRRPSREQDVVLFCSRGDAERCQSRP